MNPRAKRLDVDALFAPLVRADQPEHLTQRHHGFTGGRAIRLLARFLHNRRATQRNCVFGIERQEQHAKRARPLRLGEAVQIERLGGSGRRGRRCIGGRAAFLRFCLGGLFRPRFDASSHRLQQLACVLEIAAPENGRAFASQPIRRVGGHLVIADHHALGRRDSAFRVPERRTVLAFFLPFDVGRCGAGARRSFGMHAE